MARVIAIANQKGGVGKSTTAVNLATSLAAAGAPTLMIDLDPQGNASTGLGVPISRRDNGTYRLLTTDLDPRQTVQETNVPGLLIVAADNELAGGELELAVADHRERKLADAIASLLLPDTTIFIDCPPSLGLLTINALAAADAVLVPLQCEFFALEGLSQLMRTVERVRRAFNPKLEVQGIVLTMFDRRNNLSELVAADARAFFGTKVYHTVIPRNVRVSEAPSHGKPVVLYDYKSAGAQAYIQLAAEFIHRERSRVAT